MCCLSTWILISAGVRTPADIAFWCFPLVLLSDTCRGPQGGVTVTQAVAATAIQAVSADEFISRQLS